MGGIELHLYYIRLLKMKTRIVPIYLMITSIGPFYHIIDKYINVIESCDNTIILKKKNKLI